MLQDYEVFVQLCEKRGMSVPAEISEAIKAASSTGELCFSCLSIMAPVCEIIAQMLTSSSTIRLVDFSDCMLLSKGLNPILNALCEGTNVTVLNLKGNNISGSAVAQLGQVFTQNNTLKRLRIEWNSLGSQTESFDLFCEGLTKNHNMEEIDLRYNQISPSCAESLYKVIRRNKSLKTLDLSWNTLGLQGGEQILKAMQESKSVIKLGLRGNCIPEDVIHSIEKSAYDARSRRAAMEVNFSHEANAMRTREVGNVLENSQVNEIISVLLPKGNVAFDEPREREDVGLGMMKDKVAERERSLDFFAGKDQSLLEVNTHVSLSDSDADLTKSKEFRKTVSPDEEKLVDNDKLKNSEHFEKSDRVNANSQQTRMGDVDCKIRELNKMLKERTDAIGILTNEIAAKSSELDATKENLSQLQVELGVLREEKNRTDSEKAQKIAECEETRKEMEEKLRIMFKAFNDINDKCLHEKEEAEAKVCRYERNIHRSTLENSMLRKKLVSASHAYEDKLSKDKMEMHRLKMESRERENMHKIEVNLLKTSLKETDQVLDECQALLQKTRTELREVNNNQASLKERLNEAEHFVQRYTRLEENFQKLKEEKDVLDDKLTESQRVVVTLQRQVVSLQGELIEPQKRYDLLKDELDLKNQKTDRLQNELTEERVRIKEQNIQIEKLTQQITSLNIQLNEVQSVHAEDIQEREREKKILKEAVARKSRKLSEIRADEVQRANQLHAAVSKYLGSIGPNPVS